MGAVYFTSPIFVLTGPLQLDFQTYFCEGRCDMNHDAFRSIPPVNAIADLISERMAGVIAPELALTLARQVQDQIRQELQSGSQDDPGLLVARRLERLAQTLSSPRLGRALNGTGIVVHTNLGRAPVSERAAAAMRMAASSSVALEIDPVSGQRGGRMDEISTLLLILAGAEQSLVVNNNAAAVLLALTALAHGKKVAVSRSEAVEIGGGFRIPDVLAQSGAALMEVGTTNRTYARDYARAASDGAELFLKVHPSNFSIQGFVASPSLAELRGIADLTGAILIEDLGSGTLVGTETYGIDHEPTVQESIGAGADVVTFSGDKLLGGPQAGIICGKRRLIDQIASYPLARAVRADKTSLAGLAETLRHYLRGDHERSVPVWMSIAASESSLRHRAEHIAALLGSNGIEVDSVSTVNFVGGGSLPGQSLAGHAVRLKASTSGEVSELARSLRQATPVPVFGRIEENAVLVELRTIMPRDDELLTESMGNALVSPCAYSGVHNG